VIVKGTKRRNKALQHRHLLVPLSLQPS